MEQHFKDHINALKRYQTSIGRDLEEGCRLDRNEKVSNFSDEVMADLLSQFRNYSLSASPEASTLYGKIAENLNIDQSKIYVTGGITEGIKILYETLTNPGDNVIVLDPTYPMYMVHAKLQQLEYRKFIYTDDCRPDLTSLYQNMDKRTKIVVIPNPNLPIESVFTIDELRDIVGQCKKRGIVLVIDEAYHYFGAPTVLDLIDEFNNLIIMRTFSKAYGLAGIRLGFMVSQKKNITYFSNTRSLVESNTLTMTVAEYFLDHSELRDLHVREVNEGGKYLQGELTQLGLRWFGGNVTNGILIFLNSRESSDDVVKFMREQKIYIRGAFEKPYHACIRVSLGDKKILSKFVQFLKIWMGQKVKI